MAHYSIRIRDHFMCGHTLRGALFGPAEGRHGATYEVIVEIRGPSLDNNNVLLDLNRAERALSRVLEPLRFSDLDEVFPGVNTTTEFLCRRIHDGVAEGLPPAFRGVVRVELVENPRMAAAYEAAVPGKDRRAPAEPPS